MRKARIQCCNSRDYFPPADQVQKYQNLKLLLLYNTASAVTDGAVFIGLSPQDLQGKISSSRHILFFNPHKTKEDEYQLKLHAWMESNR